MREVGKVGGRREENEYQEQVTFKIQTSKEDEIGKNTKHRRRDKG